MEEKKNNKKTNHDPTTKEHSSRGRQSPLLAACSRGTRQKRCCWGDCLNSMTNKGLTMHGFQGALFSFLCFYFLFFLFCFILYFCCFFCLISVFWPHPGEPSAFDFSLYGYMVNFLSHSSEMETFKYSLYIHLFIFFYTAHHVACYLLQSLRPD